MKYISVLEAARILECSEATIRNLIYKELLPAVKLNRAFRIDIEDIKRCLKYDPKEPVNKEGVRIQETKKNTRKQQKQ